MRDKHWVVVILETHRLYFPSSSLLDLNSNLYAGLWVLWVRRQRGNSCIKCLSPTSKVQRSPSWSLQVLSYWGSFSTLTQPPHYQLVCISTRPVSLHSFPKDWNLPTSLPGHLHLLMPGRPTSIQYQSLASNLALLRKPLLSLLPQG